MFIKYLLWAKLLNSMHRRLANRRAYLLESTKLTLTQIIWWFPQCLLLCWVTSCNGTWVHLHLVLHSLAGPVVSILGFQVHADVTLQIGISTNNTQCVSLLVQGKNIEVKNVNLQIAEVYVRSFFLIFWIKWPVCQDILAGTTETSSAKPVVWTIHKGGPEKGLCLQMAHWVWA